ncbi:integrator complex subunit 12 [Coccinella septempunctata]|uniref:integrator complex subunit 12 n=1 Tax=Coccinella septempunctata TaxID=41139 RepID=UPI001D07FA40|nr:integrator complex subunit 12 [Coccinella septempunctata]
MNFLNITDMDWHLIKCVGYLHSGDSLTKDNAVALQSFLEESIKNKYGIAKDFTHLVSTCIKPECIDRVEEYKPMLNIYEDSKASNSDNELELDLLKEDLMCVVCDGMDVAAKNQLLECSHCHALYHQDCHEPCVTSQDSFESWVCSTCKDVNKKTKLYSSSSNNATSSTSQSVSSVTSSNLKLTLSKSSSHRHSGSGSNDNYKSSSDKSSNGNASSSSKSSSSSMLKSQSSGSSSSRNVTPNINIISADKRIQNMKKKAAKLQEKRKLPKIC